MRMHGKAVKFVIAVCFIVVGVILSSCSSSKAAQKTTTVAAQELKTPVKLAQKQDTAKQAAQDSAITKVETEKVTAQTVAQKPEVPTSKKSQVRSAPDFDLQGIFYDEYKFSTYKGQKPVLLFFFATWCPYCRGELAVLDGRYPALVQNGVEVFAVDVGETIEKVADFMKARSPGYRVLVDTDTTVSNAYRVMGVPTYVLINMKGEIVFQDNSFPENYESLIGN